MIKNRRLVEDFIFRDEFSTPASKSFLPITSLVLPTHELRYSIDEAKLEELTATILSVGLIEPILVRPIETQESRWEIVAGARRYRAAQKAGLNEVPVVIRELNDSQTLEIAIIENLQREELKSLEETEAILKLLALKLAITVEAVPPLLHRIQNELRERTATNNVIGKEEIEIVQNVFKSLGMMEMDSFINNRLPLLNLPSEILEALRQGKIAYTKAQVIARIQNPIQRKEILAEAVAKELSLSQIRERVKELENTSNSKSESETVLLKKQVDLLYKRIKKAKLWNEPTKREQIKNLLQTMEAMLEGEEAK